MFHFLQIGFQCITSLKELPESTAVAVLDEVQMLARFLQLVLHHHTRFYKYNLFSCSFYQVAQLVMPKELILQV